jgi:GNAT superfamily N-acetyltransferase
MHRMIVPRAIAGTGMGNRLLLWANKQAAAAGKYWLRLDAWKDNPELHEYYKRQGFQLLGIVNLAHRGSGALFQKSVR